MGRLIHQLNLHAGEWVEVRSKEEVLGTLDDHGRLEELPFMPEMLKYCGERLRVVSRAHKTCDPPNGLRGRRMLNAVHLEGIRCDGQAHGGCQAGCLIFWKEAWLRRACEGASVAQDARRNFPALVSKSESAPCCTEQKVQAGVFALGEPPDPMNPTYACQSTQLSQATLPLHWWDLRQYWEDYTSGNVGASQIAAAFLYFLYHKCAEAGLGFGSLMRWAYDRFQAIRGGSPYPSRIGRIPTGTRTPSVRLDLQPGELVRVKSYQEILDTLDEDSHNRGLYFDPEAVPFCSKVFRVHARIQKLINEKTGKMLHLKNDALVLENVFCQSRYATHRRFCPRAIYSYWREIWLERIPDSSRTEATQPTSPLAE